MDENPLQIHNKMSEKIQATTLPSLLDFHSLGF